jgi:hypothetical protein
LLLTRVLQRKVIGFDMPEVALDVLEVLATAEWFAAEGAGMRR